MTSETLAAYSLVAVYSAIAVYALAFITYVLDLSKRAAVAQAAATPYGAASATAVTATTANAADGTTTVLEKPATASTSSVGRASRWQRTAFALTILAWVIHIVALVTRAVAAGHVPWANLFEFALMGTGVIVGVFLITNIWRDVRFLGAYVTAVVILLLGLVTVNFYVDATPLAPPLQSVWLGIHVFVATLGTGFFAVGGGLSIAQLLQTRRESGKAGLRFLQTFPSAEALETMANRIVIVGFALWTFTVMAGSIWAERAWGRYWGWDTKEVWSFIIWVVFAGYIHARATRGWRGTRSAWLAIIGLGAVFFNFTIVNLFFAGLHSYSGLPPH